jgi:hypothetical protein
VLDRRPGQHLLQRDGKVLENDDDLGTRILELMLKFARRVQRVDVHHHVARTQGTENTNRILQDIRHHQRHAGALRQLEDRLQIGGEIPRQLVEFPVGDLDTHVDIGHAIAILRNAFSKSSPSD